MLKQLSLVFIIIFSTTSFASGNPALFEPGVYSGEGILSKSDLGPVPYLITLSIEPDGHIRRVQSLKNGTVISDSHWQIVYTPPGGSFHFVDINSVIVGNGYCGDLQHCRYNFVYQDPDRGHRVFITEDLVRVGNRWSRKGRVFKPGATRETFEEWSEILVKNP